MKKNKIIKSKVNESEDGYEYKVSHIDWDVDDPSVLDNLPESVIVTVPEDICAVEEEGEWISDYLSDTYGFCHNGFLYDAIGEFDESRDTCYKCGEPGENYIDGRCLCDDCLKEFEDKGWKGWTIDDDETYDESSEDFATPEFEEEFQNILDGYEKLPDGDELQKDLNFFGDAYVDEKDEDFPDEENSRNRVRIYHVSVLGCEYDVRFEYDKRTLEVIDRTFIQGESCNESMDIRKHRFMPKMDTSTKAFKSMKDKEREGERRHWNQRLRNGDYDDEEYEEYDESMNESRKNEDWFGVKGARFIYHGDWNDPEVQYDGVSLNYFDVKGILLDEYREEHPEDRNDKGFDDWMALPEQKSSIQSALDILVQGGCGKPIE